jgi:flavin reductase (DIM6/NTAB) family NADH-FMN oxidoreductase RutF
LRYIIISEVFGLQILNESDAIALTGPFPYTLVTSLDKNGRPNAMGVAWVTRVSFEPLLIIISIDHRRYSHESIQMHSEFVLNYPSQDQAEAAWICGTRSGRDGDKIKLAGLKLIDSKVVKVPTIEGATVAFECEVVNQFETGDHTVFVGKVVGISGNLDKPKHLYVSSQHKLFGMSGDGKSSSEAK